ncbi:lipase [Monoraphidium neglectum]|uniref:Lipase n=1 Tax=Monoraphidium neglectum TaxID=145388 RepID=A0A0D2M401_9CHLO|nr:lipase [Monoraphidium neglectum]KIY96036.1 lipase [Monoraphidium neglectum]|eukprot:XP_013895056.1 lipase [Monoraphidium neglectum]
MFNCAKFPSDRHTALAAHLGALAASARFTNASVRLAETGFSVDVDPGEPRIAPLNFGDGQGSAARAMEEDAAGLQGATTHFISCTGGTPRSSGRGSLISNASSGSDGPEDGVQRTGYTCTTSDGVRLHLVRGFCAAAAAARPRGHPVMLVPGLASSAEATFDVVPRLSLFGHLARQGYDVWLVDLRGNGKSGAPDVRPLSEGWCVDDHLFRDMPSAVELILRETGAEQLHWIGHSMGGMLATGALSMQGPLAQTVRSVVMLGSGCYGAGSWYSLLKPLVLGLCCFGFPGGVAGATIGKLAGTWASLAVMEAVFYWRSNTEVDVARRLMSTAFRFIPRGLVYQFLASIATDGGLTTADGRMQYCDPKVLRHVTTPVLGVTGDWDLFCPPAGGLKTVQQFGGDARRFIFVGPGYGTAKDHCGHFDVICGRNARSEVWPYVTSFLEEHDNPIIVGVADVVPSEGDMEALGRAAAAGARPAQCVGSCGARA